MKLILFLIGLLFLGCGPPCKLAIQTDRPDDKHYSIHFPSDVVHYSGETKDLPDKRNKIYKERLKNYLNKYLQNVECDVTSESITFFRGPSASAEIQCKRFLSVHATKSYTKNGIVYAKCINDD
jgi:hypothetical protein